jgi:hypothetical protein
LESEPKVTGIGLEKRLKFQVQDPGSTAQDFELAQDGYGRIRILVKPGNGQRQFRTIERISVPRLMFQADRDLPRSAAGTRNVSILLPARTGSHSSAKRLAPHEARLDRALAFSGDNPRNICPSRPGMTEDHKLTHLALTAAKNSLHRAVGAIAHPTVHSPGFSLPLQPAAIPYTLHNPGNEDAQNSSIFHVFSKKR